MITMRRHACAASSKDGYSLETHDLQDGQNQSMVSSHDVNTMILRWPRIISVLNSLVIIILIFTSSSLVIGEDHEGSSDPLDWLRASIPGEPELDYPILGEIAETSFSCNGRIFGGELEPEIEKLIYL